MQYEIVHPVQLADSPVIHMPGEILDESAFGPGPGTQVYQALPKPDDYSDEQYQYLVTQQSTEDNIGEFVTADTEATSLLKSGHIIVAT